MTSCCGLNHVWFDVHGSYAYAVCDYCKTEVEVVGKEAHDKFLEEHSHNGLPCPGNPWV